MNPVQGTFWNPDSRTFYMLVDSDSYNSNEMGANALIGTATGAASALTGPAVVSANVAKGGAAMLARAGINALGTQASQIVHNEYYDEGSYPSGGESAGAAGLGAIASGGGELTDRFVSQAVTVVSGNQAAGQVAGSVTYNLVKNYGSSYYVNQGLNFIDRVDEEESIAE